MAETKSGIYKITNTTNGKFYIGSAKQFNRRWNNHKSLLERNKHDNIHLQRAYNKDGADSFKFEVIEYCEIEKLLEREDYWYDLLKPNYNFRNKATSNLGLKYKYTPESYEKLKSHKGKKLSIETRNKMSQSRKGFKHTEEVKKRLSEIVTKRYAFVLNKPPIEWDK